MIIDDDMNDLCKTLDFLLVQNYWTFWFAYLSSLYCPHRHPRIHFRLKVGWRLSIGQRLLREWIWKFVKNSIRKRHFWEKFVKNWQKSDIFYNILLLVLLWNIISKKVKYRRPYRKTDKHLTDYSKCCVRSRPVAAWGWSAGSRNWIQRKNQTLSVLVPWFWPPKDTLQTISQLDTLTTEKVWWYQ